ncbi:MAG: hypothetical protein JST80_09180 [Bdellovibrionales bacterium]|nr:hypothetical protein [Bdellovibrionales bacterium]
MLNSTFRAFGTALLLITSFARADIELPRGSLAGCPFIHEDVYDLGPVLESLKAHLCALYAPTLAEVSEGGGFMNGSRKAGGVLADCVKNHKTLKLNGLVTSDEFKINYDDECSYINYQRELQIQNLIAELIKP